MNELEVMNDTKVEKMIYEARRKYVILDSEIFKTKWQGIFFDN